MAGKSDLANALVESSGMSKADASDAVDSMLNAIVGMLSEGERVSLAGFGTFSTAHRDARKGRNPATGETIDIAAKTVAKFKAGKALADAVNN